MDTVKMFTIPQHRLLKLIEILVIDNFEFFTLFVIGSLMLLAY